MTRQLPDAAAPLESSEGLRLFEDVRDYVPTFDDPAFYWLCRRVRQEAASAASTQSAAPSSGLRRTAESPTDWQLLLDRPSDYRGRLIAIEGILAARREFRVESRPGIGTLHQCELAEPGARSVCTVVAVDDPSDIPLRSRVRAVGYFLKIRSYETQSGAKGAGPLLVACGLELVQRPQPASLAPAQFRRATRLMLLVGAVALVVIWFALRRRLGRRRISSSPPMSRPGSGHDDESPDDFDWLLKGDGP